MDEKNFHEISNDLLALSLYAWSIRLFGSEWEASGCIDIETTQLKQRSKLSKAILCALVDSNWLGSSSPNTLHLKRALLHTARPFHYPASLGL